MTLLLLAGVGHLAWQAVLANGRYAADRRNPYVYAQTSPDLLQARPPGRRRSPRRIPRARQMLVKVMAPDSDYWPLPWYLRNLKQVGWWERGARRPYAPVMIVSSQLHAGLWMRSRPTSWSGYFELRPQVFLELYVDLDLWRDYLARNPPKPD